jgi:uncharacterized protein (TIGR01777 family)
MRIIITGGTGLIGRPLSQALVAAGHEVVVLTRNPQKVKNMPAGVRLQTWDGETAAGWGELADGAHAIVNLAGEGIADGRWSSARKQAIRQSRVNAGKAVMAAIQAATVKPKVLIQASAVGYYGAETGDALVSEQDSPGADFLSKVCFDWELSTAAVSRLGVRRAVIRTGIVLSNEGGAFPKLVMPFKFFAGGPLGNGKQWMPWIHWEDEVRAIQFLIDNEQAEGVFNLAAPNPVRNNEMAKAIGEVKGRPAFMPAPGFAINMVFGEMGTVVLDGQRAVPTQLQQLGFEFKYSTIEAALRNLLNAPAAPAATAAVSEKVGV